MMLVLLLVLVAGAFALQDCPANSHYESCGTACPLTCENYKNPPKFCVLMCNPGCHCDEGYVKTEDGSCVLPESCPNRGQEVCGENERYNGCGTACPLTCDNYNNPPKVCTLQCVIGCECERGYVRSADGRCVRPEECPNRSEVCGENERYNDCGTACPLTCDNYNNPPKICTLQCVIGCACERGYVRSADGRCVRPEECPSRSVEKNCEDKPEEGVCYAYFRSYYYDKESNTCKKFIYGGCGGNGNRYETEEECLINCAKSSYGSVCDQPKVTGPCRALFHRYFFNQETGLCEKFIYGGCNGNGNNFHSQKDCEAMCYN